MLILFTFSVFFQLLLSWLSGSFIPPWSQQSWVIDLEPDHPKGMFTYLSWGRYVMESRIPWWNDIEHIFVPCVKNTASKPRNTKILRQVKEGHVRWKDMGKEILSLYRCRKWSFCDAESRWWMYKVLRDYLEILKDIVERLTVKILKHQVHSCSVGKPPSPSILQRFK